jgi:hypothetical protein
MAFEMPFVVAMRASGIDEAGNRMLFSRQQAGGNLGKIRYRPGLTSSQQSDD